MSLTLAIGYLWWKIPAPPRIIHHDDVEYSGEHLFEVLTNRHLLRLDAREESGWCDGVEGGAGMRSYQ